MYSTRTEHYLTILGAEFRVDWNPDGHAIKLSNPALIVNLQKHAVLGWEIWRWSELLPLEPVTPALKPALLEFIRTNGIPSTSASRRVRLLSWLWSV